MSEISEDIFEAAWIAFRDSDKPAPYNQVKDAVNAALSALTAGKPEQSRWRPIETAPKDGTWILVWEDAALAPRMHVVHWGTSEWGGNRETWVTMALGPNPDTYDADDATHWMPLPTPPTAGGGDAENDAFQDAVVTGLGARGSWQAPSRL